MKHAERLILAVALASAAILILSASAAMANQHPLIDIFWWVWR
jgi:hypothetical protein